MSFADILSAYGTKRGLREAAKLFSAAEIEKLLAWWLTYCRGDQRPPSQYFGPPWTVWLVMGGRGAGKTRTGAEWVRGLAQGEPGFAKPRAGRIALVGETIAAVRDVMVEGPSGLMALHPRGQRPVWSPSLRRLAWPNGALAHVFSSEDPDSLRGPQFEAAWADELAKWRYPEETWDMLQFGLRLGRHPQEVVTTTPRPIPLLKRLLADPAVPVSRAATSQNTDYLAPAFLDAVVGRYAGTRLGRQELEGELISERADALWTRDILEACRVAAAPDLARIVVAVDPPASSGPRADACGLVAAGVDSGGTAYVIADHTAGGLKPPEWAAKAIALYRRWHADALVVEVNRAARWRAPCCARSIPACRSRPCAPRAASFCAPSPSRCSTSRGACAMSARFRRSRTSSAISGRAASHPAAPPTASTPSSGRSPT